MDINFSDLIKSKVTFTIKNERECNWIFDHLRNEHNFHIINPDAVSYEARRATINESVEASKFEFSERKRWIAEKSVLCSEALIPESEFEWINKEDKVLYSWVHAYLVAFYAMPLKQNTTFDEYRKDIIACFDNLSLSRIDKERLLLDVKMYWNDFLSGGETFRWLDENNKELIKWAWKYFDSKKIPIASISDKTATYGGIIAAFYLWKALPDSKELFIVKMKKALNQKKQRDKRDGKKAYNIVMSEDIKQKLNDLAEYHDRKINQTLERLINEEYERVCNNN
jgi:hypothetical protein